MLGMTMRRYIHVIISNQVILRYLVQSWKVLHSLKMVWVCWNLTHFDIYYILCMLSWFSKKWFSLFYIPTMNSKNIVLLYIFYQFLQQGLYETNKNENTPLNILWLYLWYMCLELSKQMSRKQSKHIHVWIKAYWPHQGFF